MKSSSTPFTQYVRAVRRRYFSASHRKLYSGRLSQADIRLLTILPSHDSSAPIACELHRYSVSSAPAYEGLSYVWGDPENVATVICNGITLEVTKSLRNALWRIRDIEEPRTIWADALCMDQDDVKEKNIHVPLMGRVFSQATNTVIHLGEASQKEAIEAEAGLKEIMEYMETSSRQAGSSAGTAEAFYTSYMETLSEQTLATLPWDAIIKFFSVAWFSRTWCVQEIMLARDTALDSYAIYGHIRIPYQCIAKVALFLDVAKECGFKFAQKLCLSASIGVIGGLEEFAGKDVTLLQILASFREHQASDPRDKVYGILGVLRQRFGFDLKGIDVDYTKTVAQVYIDSAIEILRTYQDLQLLDYISHLRGLDRDLGFPTWVPRWDRPEGWDLIDVVDRVEFKTTCSASNARDRGAPKCWDVQGDRLLVRGSRYDRVARTLSSTLR